MSKKNVSLPESALQRQRDFVANEGVSSSFFGLSEWDLGPWDWRRPLRVGAFIVSFVALVFVTFLSLFTVSGQALDQLVLDTVLLSFPHATVVAWPVARSISLWGIASITVIAGVLAAFRQRWELGLRIVIFVLGANVSTQILKTWILARPYLGVGFELPNSLPSGHTTVALCGVLALVVTLPQRFRVPAAVAGTLLASSVALSVVLLGWHRPSDVVVAVLLVLLWALVLVPHERPQGVMQGLNLRLLLIYLGLLSCLIGGWLLSFSWLKSLVTQLISLPRAPGSVTDAGTPLTIFTMFPWVSYFFAISGLLAIFILVGFVVHFVVLLESGHKKK